MKSFGARLRALLTPGHAVAFVILLVVVYQAWGRVFLPGGTGSNVVLGLLVALAALYLGTTNFGPWFDDVFAGTAGRHVRRLTRDARALVEEVGDFLKRARKGKSKPKLDDKQLDVIEGARTALADALHDVEKPAGKAPTEAQLAHLTSKIAELEAVLQRELGNQTTGAAMFAQAKSLGFAFAVAVALRLFLVAPFQIPSGSMIPTLLIGDHLFVFRAMYGLQSPVGETPSYLVRWSIPKPGDVVVFEAPPWVPRNAGEDWIKRVIAGPGQRVKRVGQTVYVDDKPYTLLGEGKMMRYMDFTELGGGRGRWDESVATYFEEEIPGATHSTFVDMPPTTADWPNPGEPRVDQRGLSCTSEECTVKDGFVFVMGDNRDHSSDGRVWGAVPVDNIKGKALFIWVSVDGSGENLSLGKFTLPRFRWDRLADGIR